MDFAGDLEGGCGGLVVEGLQAVWKRSDWRDVQWVCSELICATFFSTLFFKFGFGHVVLHMVDVYHDECTLSKHKVHISASSSLTLRYYHFTAASLAMAKQENNLAQR